MARVVWRARMEFGRAFRSRTMKPAAFDYVAPRSLEAAVDALAAANGDGKVMAGGQSLMPLLNFRMARPSDRRRSHAHSGPVVHRARGATQVAIGALTRHADLEFSDLIADASAGHGGRHAACGASGDPQPGHHRRQPVACGSSGGTADAGGVLWRHDQGAGARAAGAKSRPRNSSSPRWAIASSRMRSCSRSIFRS